MLADLPERMRDKAEKAAREMRASFAKPEDASVQATAAGGSDTPPSVRFPSEAQVALFPSCEDPLAARRTIALAQRIGAEYLVVADVTMASAGYELIAGGFLDAFRTHAETMARQLQGYARIVVDCPTCAHTFKHDYPAHGIKLRPEIVHLVEFLGPFANKIAATKKLPPAFYHDPCYLGRQGGGVYDPPRRLLERVLVEVREFSRNRQESECCGGGGLVPETMPETAEAIADNRLAEVLASDTPRVITACSTCRKRLSRAGVESRDLVEVLEAATR